MKTNFKITLIFIVIIIFAISWFIWGNLQKKEIQKCSNVVLEGYLVTDCPWQACPWLKDKKSSFGRKCSLDIWLSKSQPKGLLIPEIFRNIDNAWQPLTSKCLLEGLTSFDPWTDELLYPRVTLIGTYKKMKVCNLLRKYLEPECYGCSEDDVFVPCEVI